MPYVLAIAMPGLPEWIIIAFIALLIFGKRLPEVGRTFGKGIVEFKKGLRGIDEETDAAASARSITPSAPALPQDQPAQPAQKFDPYTGKPLEYQFDPYTGKPLAPAANNPADKPQA